MQKERFHYCLRMEAVEWELFGLKKCASGMASAFSNPIYLKKRCRAFLSKMRKRIDNIITTDETLRLLLINDIERLDKEFKLISNKTNNDIEIFAEFFVLVTHLLGWAHSDGNLYRTPIYYQTGDQRKNDLKKSARLNLPEGLYEAFKRRQIIKQLLSEGHSHSAIALIMSLTVSTIKSLEQAEHIDKMYHEILRRIKKDKS